MVCEKCAAREKAESQQRANCETERKRLDKQSQRLTVALTVVSTLVAKETLDQAMTIFDTVEKVTTVADGRDVRDVRDVSGGYDYTPQLNPESWHVAGSYLPSYAAPDIDMSLFVDPQYAAVPEPTPLWFFPMWALTPRRQR
tara:strand:+ start:648 stop:1073 length:426 start_codon:yes stop_codon:yes gene_type:complete